MTSILEKLLPLLLLWTPSAWRMIADKKEGDLPPIERLLPSDTPLVLTAPDVTALKREARKTVLADLWREEEVQGGKGEIRKLLADTFGLDSRAPDEEEVWNQLRNALPSREERRGLLSGQISLAWVGMRTLGGAPTPEIVVAIESGKKTALWTRAFQRYVAAQKEKAVTISLRQEKVGKRTVYRLDGETEKGFLSFCEAEGAFLFCFGRGEHLDRMLARLDAPDPGCLEKAAAFQEVRAKAGADRPESVFLYFHPAHARAALPEAAVGAVEDELAGMFDTRGEGDWIGRWLRWRDLQAAGLCWLPRDKGFATRAFLKVPAPRQGIWKVLEGSSGSQELLKIVPNDSILLFHFRFDPALVKAELSRLLKELKSDQADRVRDRLERLEEGTGLDLRKDAVEGLGGEAVLAFGKPRGAVSIPEAILLLSVKDRKKAGQVLERLADWAQAQGAPYTKTPFQKTTLYNFGGKGGRDPLSGIFQPTFAVTDHYLVGAINPHVVKQILRREGKAGEGVSDLKEFQELRARCPERTAGLAYVDWKETVTWAYNGLLQLTQLRGAFGGREKFNAAALPACETIVEHLLPGIQTFSAEPDGFRIEGWSPLPVPLESAVTEGALFLGSFALLTARVPEESSPCGAQLRRISFAIEAYRNQHGAYPRSLKDLCAEKERYGIGPEQLACPRDPARPADEQASGYCSYRLVRSAKMGDAPDPSARILIYEKAPNHRERRTVLFLDGHVATVPEERFQKMAGEQRVNWKPPPPPDPNALDGKLKDEIDRCVRELGATEFPAREKAEKRLREIGRGASPALEKAAQGTDPEIQSRAKAILEDWTEE